MTIETKIAKNGSTRYYVRDDNGKLSQISRQKAYEIQTEADNKVMANIFEQVAEKEMTDIEQANYIAHVDIETVGKTTVQIKYAINLGTAAEFIRLCDNTFGKRLINAEIRDTKNNTVNAEDATKAKSTEKKLYKVFQANHDDEVIQETATKLDIIIDKKRVNVSMYVNRKTLTSAYNVFTKALEQAVADGVISDKAAQFGYFADDINDIDFGGKDYYEAHDSLDNSFAYGIDDNTCTDSGFYFWFWANTDNGEGDNNDAEATKATDANEEIINCTDDIIITDDAYTQMIHTELANAQIASGNELPTGNITVKSGTEAWAIVGKHFPKGNLEFYRAGKGFNNEDTFCYTLDEIIYVHVTCTPDNSRVECIEIVNTYEESESERNILTVYINHDAEVNTATDTTPEYKYYIKSRRPIFGAAPNGYIKAVSGEVHEPVRRTNGTYSPKCRIYFATVIYDKPLTDEQILNYDLAVSNETFELLNAPPAQNEMSTISNIAETDGSEEDDFADEMPALFPAEDSDDDDELIDPPAITPADDFATKLAELKAKQDAAKTAELAAKKVYDEASDKYEECREATQAFLDAHADNLTEKISALEIESRITMVRDNGKERYDLFDTSQLNVYAFNGFGKMFIVRCRGNELGTYDTPAQVETVIERLKAAIERGDREFEFPTVEDLTIAEKIAAEKAEHEANQPAEVKALNAELAASKLQAPTMWVKITDGKTGFHFGSFTRGVPSEVRVDYDAVNKYGVFYFDEPMRRYDTFAQVKTAIGQFKTAIINNAKEFTFPTIEELTTPEIDKDATADSLTRAMTIALEHYQDFCRVGNLTAATNELSLYNICRKAMTELWKGEAA